MDSQSLEGFEPVFGAAEGALEEESIPCALLPFVFYLHSTISACDRRRNRLLRLQVTDFHSNTWQIIQTTDLLDDLRDQVGIGGSWEEFLQYFRDSFASENVKLILGGPASSIGGRGATSAKVIAQKSKGMPRISLSLEKLEGTSADDVMGLISVDLLKAFKCCRTALETEQKSIAQLKQSLAAAKEEARLLQAQIDTTSYRGKKRNRFVASQLTADTIDISSSKIDSAQPSQGLNLDDNKSKSTGKVEPLRNKVHLAHARRAKQRGSRLADDDE